MDILDLVKEAGYEPKRKCSTNGGEYSSPCPFCKGGDDRFLIWPNLNNKNGEYVGGRFFCPRHCGKKGDAITFLRELYGVGYREACAKLRLSPKERKNTILPRPNPKPFTAEEPTTIWKEKCKAFVDWSHKQLINSKENLKQLYERGFHDEVITHFCLGYNPKNIFRDRPEWGLPSELKDNGKPRMLWLPAGIVIPTFVHDQIIKVKIRRSELNEGDKLPKYVELSGSKKIPSIFGDTSLHCVLVLESEIDALLVQQEASDLLYCVALGGSTKSLDAETELLIKNTPIVLFLPDFDEAGGVAWNKWRNKFPSIQRILTPHEKSAGDYFKVGGNMRGWLIECIGMANAKKNIHPPKK